MIFYRKYHNHKAKNTQKMFQISSQDIPRHDRRDRKLPLTTPLPRLVIHQQKALEYKV